MRPRGCTVRSHLEAIRPHQWLKNLLVFLPMLAAHQLTAPTFLASLAAFLSFSLIASSAYVVNDLVDLPADRAHLRKRNRPFASGRLPVSHGLWLAPGLLLAGVLVAASGANDERQAEGKDRRCHGCGNEAHAVGEADMPHQKQGEEIEREARELQDIIGKDIGRLVRDARPEAELGLSGRRSLG